MKKTWMLILAAVLVCTLTSCQTTEQNDSISSAVIQTTPDQQVGDLEDPPAESSDKGNEEYDQVLKDAETFLNAYYIIHAEDGFNASEYYKQYEPYLTEYGRSQLAPLHPEMSKTDSISYVSEIMQKTILTTSVSGSSAKAAGLVRIWLSVEHSSPSYYVQFILLDMKKSDDGSWLVNDVLIETKLSDEIVQKNIF